MKSAAIAAALVTRADPSDTAADPRQAAGPSAGDAGIPAAHPVADRLQHLLRRQAPGSPPHPLAAVLAAYHQRRRAAGLSAAPAAEPPP